MKRNSDGRDDEPSNKKMKLVDTDNETYLNRIQEEQLKYDEMQQALQQRTDEMNRMMEEFEQYKQEKQVALEVQKSRIQQAQLEQAQWLHSRLEHNKKSEKVFTSEGWDTLPSDAILNILQHYELAIHTYWYKWVEHGVVNDNQFTGIYPVLFGYFRNESRTIRLIFSSIKAKTLAIRAYTQMPLLLSSILRMPDVRSLNLKNWNDDHMLDISGPPTEEQVLENPVTNNLTYQSISVQIAGTDFHQTFNVPYQCNVRSLYSYVREVLPEKYRNRKFQLYNCTFHSVLLSESKLDITDDSVFTPGNLIISLLSEISFDHIIRLVLNDDIPEFSRAYSIPIESKCIPLAVSCRNAQSLYFGNHSIMDFSIFSRLKKLHMGEHYGKLSELNLHTCKNLTALKQRSKLSTQDFEYLSRMSQLKRISVATVDNTFTLNPLLTGLSIKCDTLSVQTMTEIMRLEGLTKLKISGAPGCIPSECYPYFATNQTITKLHINDSVFWSNAKDYVEQNRVIKTLHLENAELMHIATSYYNLTHLTLGVDASQTSSTPDLTKNILHNLKRLQFLTISNITDDAAVHLFMHQNLKHLIINDSDLSFSLKCAEYNTSIQRLQCSYAASLLEHQPLSSVFHMKSLTDLDVTIASGCYTDEELMETLQTLSDKGQPTQLNTLKILGLCLHVHSCSMYELYSHLNNECKISDIFISERKCRCTELVKNLSHNHQNSAKSPS